MPNPKSGTVVPNLKVAIKEVETAKCTVDKQHQDVLFETSLVAGQKWKLIGISR